MARGPLEGRAVEPAQAVEVDFVESDVEHEFISISAPSAQRAPKISITTKAGAAKRVKRNNMTSNSDSYDSGVSPSLEESDSKKQERGKKHDPLEINYLHWLGLSFIFGILILFFKSFTQNDFDIDILVLATTAAVSVFCLSTAVLGTALWPGLGMDYRKDKQGGITIDGAYKPETDKEQSSAERHSENPKPTESTAIRQNPFLIGLVCGALFFFTLLDEIVASRTESQEPFDSSLAGLMKSALLLFCMICLLVKSGMKGSPVVQDAQDISDNAACMTSTEALQDFLEYAQQDFLDYAQQYFNLRHWAGFTIHFILVLLAAGPEPQGLAKALAYASRFGLLTINVAEAFFGIAKLLRSSWFDWAAHTVGAKIKAVATELRQKAIHFAAWCRQHPAWGLGLVILILSAACALYFSYEDTKEALVAPIDGHVEQTVDFVEVAEKLKEIEQRLVERIRQLDELKEKASLSNKILSFIPGMFL